MKCLRVGLLIFAILSASQAWGFACRSYQDRNEIDIRGLIGRVGPQNNDENDGKKLIADCPEGVIDFAKPTTYFFSSPGGNIDQVREYAAELKAKLKTAKETSNIVPIVVVDTECQSACIPILSSLNRLAGQGAIRLIIDRKTILGFHGCSDHEAGAPEDDEGVYSSQGTARYLTNWTMLGGSADWIRTNYQFFETATLTQMNPEDGRLADSDLVNHAEIIATNTGLLIPLAAVSSATP